MNDDRTYEELKERIDIEHEEKLRALNIVFGRPVDDGPLVRKQIRRHKVALEVADGQKTTMGGG